MLVERGGKKKFKANHHSIKLSYFYMGFGLEFTHVPSMNKTDVIWQKCHKFIAELYKRLSMCSNQKAVVKYRSLSAIITAQAALLCGDLQRAFHAPQPPGPKQKRRAPPVSQFSCSPDWLLKEGGPPGEKEPVCPVSLFGGRSCRKSLILRQEVSEGPWSLTCSGQKCGQLIIP